MVVIARLDLDRFDLLTLAKFYVEGLVTLSEIETSRAYKAMSPVHALLWTRQVQDMKNNRKEIAA